MGLCTALVFTVVGLVLGSSLRPMFDSLSLSPKQVISLSVLGILGVGGGVKWETHSFLSSSMNLFILLY
jgi:hypothetical protein